MAVLQGWAAPALGSDCNCKCVEHLLLVQRGAVHPMRMPIEAKRIKDASMQLNAVINARSTLYKAAATQLLCQDRSPTPDTSAGLLGRLEHLVLLLDVPALDVDARLPPQGQRLDVLVGIGLLYDF
jgi:hypothetical protein